MPDLPVMTTRETDMILGEATVQGFKTSLRGSLLCPGDAGYEDARKVWNANVDKRPALIACCAGVADVINAVHFARTHHLLVSVRGGGHNVAGRALQDATENNSAKGRGERTEQRRKDESAHRSGKQAPCPVSPAQPSGERRHDGGGA